MVNLETALFLQIREIYTMLHFYDYGKIFVLKFQKNFIIFSQNFYLQLIDAAQTINPGYGIWYGEWEVTKVLNEINENASQYIGERLELGSRNMEQYCSRFYFVEADEKSIGKLVEMMKLGEKQHFVAFYEMSDDFYWDKIIIKDEMTIILVKDGNYFEANRISEKDPLGHYGGI